MSDLNRNPLVFGRGEDQIDLEKKLAEHWAEQGLEYRQGLPAKGGERHKRHVRDMDRLRKPAVVEADRSGPVETRQMTEEEKERYCQG